jgi:cytochrome bd-type quinol oxidase subunit 2
MRYGCEMVRDSGEKKLRIASFAIHATRGLIRDHGIRRRVMLALLAGALVMLVSGTTFLSDALDAHEHAARYVVFWFACAWLTLAAVLLALFDALIVRAQGRAARRVLREQLARERHARSDRMDGER